MAPIARRTGVALAALSLVAVACAPAEIAIETPTTTTTTAPAPTTTTTAPVSGTATTTTAVPATTAQTLPPLTGLALENIADGFVEPIGLAVRRGDEHLYVVERQGLIRAVDERGTVLEEPFADLRSVVHVSSIEQGLLGLAFHPDDPDRVFVFHSRPDNDNQLVEYRVVDGVLDPDSARVLLVVDRESDKIRHNAGNIAFGPDGLLYLSVGDGARASVNGQDPSTILGAIVRIDVDTGDPYAIPDDNPFVGGGGAPEVFAWGLRNPWRFWIDVETMALFIGDVGQDNVEEIDIAPIGDPGRNFGWPIMEGEQEFYGGEPDGPLTAPAFTVDHGDGGCSITAGPVYRGAAIPEYTGRMFFADWCLGWIRSVAVTVDSASDPLDHSSELPTGMVSSFGLDHDGEVLVVDYAAGSVGRIVPVR